MTPDQNRTKDKEKRKVIAKKSKNLRSIIQSAAFQSVHKNKSL